MKRWKLCAAFRRPKDMKGNSKRPKGVVMAVFWMYGDLVVSPYEVDFGKGVQPARRWE